MTDEQRILFLQAENEYLQAQLTAQGIAAQIEANGRLAAENTALLSDLLEADETLSAVKGIAERVVGAFERWRGGK